MAGHIISVIGGKGGVGKSVVAANLAIAYLQNFKQRPLILDLDLNSLGDQHLILGQNTNRSIVDVSKMPSGPIDPKTLAPFMVNAPQGYSFIGSPRDTIVAKDLNLDGLGKFLKAITNTFKFVVIDVGNPYEPHALKALEHSTAIFVVTTPDIIVLNQTKRALSKLQELLFPPEMVQLILNRYSNRSLINPQMIQRRLGRSVFAAIPEDVPSADGSLAKSTPVCLAAPNSALARSFSDLVRRMDQVKLLEQLARLKKPKGLSAKAKAQESTPLVSLKSGSGRSKSAPLDAWTSLKRRIHRGLVEKVDMKKLNSNDPSQQNILRDKTQKAILELLSVEDSDGILKTRDDKAQIVKEVLDEALALGPLEDLLDDASVSEIMVNSREQIYIERSGRIQTSKITFSSEHQMMNVIDRILMPLGRRVDENTPYVDARLTDGSRVHVIIPPLALRGPTITIRKFPSNRIEVKDLIQFGSMTKEIADFLRLCVEGKLNVIVSGGTGSGKTTLLNVLSNFIPSNERIITVEDSAELQLAQEHVVRLESRPKNIEGQGEVSIRDLVKSCLRMRPDRIVVGEVRDGAALDMLQAMNTGHDGSLTTIHANTPRETLSRLETLVLMAGLGLPSKAIKETIASAVHIIVQQARLSDGSRKITHISEVTGMQGDVISLQDIFLFKQEGLDKRRKIIGKFVPTGFVPKFVENMERKGMKISRKIFKAS